MERNNAGDMVTNHDTAPLDDTARKASAGARAGLWVRHVNAARWCLVTHVDDSSCKTVCRGRFAVADVEEFALHDDPPMNERCAACANETQPIELVTFEMVDDRFDDGGEA